MKQIRNFKLKKIQFSSYSRTQRSLKSNIKRKMCHNIKDGEQCVNDERRVGEGRERGRRRRYCKFAHNYNELKNKNRYNNNPKYKEFECQRIYCEKEKRCFFYHDISERRENILKDVFSQIKPQILKDQKVIQKVKLNYYQKTNNIYLTLPKLQQNKLNFSKLIPPLTTFESDQQIYLCNQMLDIFKFINEIKSTKLLTDNTNGSNQIVKQDYINGIILNLGQTDSLLKGTQKSLIIEGLRNIPILKFRHYCFTYERNKLKGQVSYVANSNGLVTFICQDMVSQKPKSLKLDIQSLNKDFAGFKQIMNTISECKQSLCKIDLCVREFIGPNDIPDLEKIFSNTLLSLDNLKVLNLKIQFDYLEDGDYERDIVDVMTDIIIKMKKKIPQLIFELNIFGIVVKLSGFSLELYSEDSKRDSLKERKKTNQMFLNSNLHQYLLKKFSQKFEPKMIKFLTIDFSNLYLTQKKQNDNSTPHHKYDNEIEKLLEGMEQIINGINDECIEKLRMKFFGFSFLFEILDNLKRNHFRFNMNLQLFFQNTPVVALRKFKPFYQLLQKKLSNKYQYSTYEGDIFTSKYSFKKFKNQQNLTPQKKFMLLVIHNASLFINYMIKDWKNVMTIKFYYNDVFHLKNILKIREQVTHIIPLGYFHYRRQQLCTIYSNMHFDFFRRRFLYIYAKMVKIRKRNPQFFFRKEILQQIFNLIQLNADGCYYDNKNDTIRF